MKRTLPLLVVAIFLASALSAVAAERAPKTPAPSAKPSWWGAPPPPKEQPKRPPTSRGSVAAVGENYVVLRTPSGFNTYTVGTDTEIMIGRAAGLLSDITVGNTAQVTFVYDQARLATHAKRILVTLPEPRGRIDSIDGNLVRLVDEFGLVWNVTVSPETRISALWKPIALEDLRPNYYARAEGQIKGNNVQATMMNIKPGVFQGIVVDVNETNIRIKTVRQEIMDGVMSPQTNIIIHPRTGSNKNGTRADIKRDMAVDLFALVHEGKPLEVLSVNLLIGQ